MPIMKKDLVIARKIISWLRDQGEKIRVELGLCNDDNFAFNPTEFIVSVRHWKILMLLDVDGFNISMSAHRRHLK